MSLAIVFSNEAAEMLLSITSFIENKWSSREAEKFLQKVHRTIGLISEQPYMFKAFPINNDTRKALVSKQTSFFYQIKENEIFILFFWDNRQEPFFNG